MPSLARSPTLLGAWLRNLLARRHRNTVVVALANKFARIVWVAPETKAPPFVSEAWFKRWRHDAVSFMRPGTCGSPSWRRLQPTRRIR
ncbi:MAG: hypothetical protein EOR68_30695 [Mesorhizobium sp.]|nr:MAG: hypothetical protein EOR68_30695 [Mesorhizobium sp.]